jgi:HD superfamily phosphodiesterase
MFPEFLSDHILVVEKCAEKLCTLYQEANKEIVLLGVWLHDMSRLGGFDEDHHQKSAEMAEQILKESDFDQNIIQAVKHICLTHRCQEDKPETLEAKILASADAMSHFYNVFYFIPVKYYPKLSLTHIREKVEKKIERDYHDKIFFDEAREIIKPQYDAWKLLFDSKI